MICLKTSIAIIIGIPNHMAIFLKPWSLMHWHPNDEARGAMHKVPQVTLNIRCDHTDFAVGPSGVDSLVACQVNFQPVFLGQKEANTVQ